MGSRSDWETMQHCAETLKDFGVPHECRIVSAHRTPEWMREYATSAADRGIEVIVAAAGGAAHLPGMTASFTTLPVVGVPIESRTLKGVDSLLSIVQMPAGVPVGTVAIGKAGAINGALYAIAILANSRRELREKLVAFRGRRAKQVPRGFAPLTPPILPGSTIGVLGSGQLGRMFAIAARKMGYRVHTFSPDEDTPTGHISDVEIVARYDDLDAVRDFARGVDVMTFEFENVHHATAAAAAEIVPVRPDGAILHTTQHRLREKSFLRDHGFPVTRFEPVRSLDELRRHLDAGFGPAILKTASWGYDGKGQSMIRSANDAKEAWNALATDEAILESLVDFELELSAVVARGVDGSIAIFELTHNRHVNGILDLSSAPMELDPSTRSSAIEIAIGIATELGLVGVMAVEMFLAGDGRILVNELAPRPHNSGHWTFDAALTSQFDQQLRAICGLPLGSTEQLRPVAMANLLGDLWAEGEPDWAAACAIPEIRLHLYGKQEPRPGRKMGHLTAMAHDVETAERMVIEARKRLIG